MNSHVIGEQLVCPACLVIFETMLGEESKDFILKVPLSNNIISRRITEVFRRITEVFDNINDNVIEKLK